MKNEGAHRWYYSLLCGGIWMLEQIFNSQTIFRFLTRDPSLPIRQLDLISSGSPLVKLSNSMSSVISAGFPLKMRHPTSSGTPSSATVDSIQLYLGLSRVPAAGGGNSGASVPHYSYYYTDKIREFRGSAAGFFLVRSSLTLNDFSAFISPLEASMMSERRNLSVFCHSGVFLGGVAL